MDAFRAIDVYATKNVEYLLVIGFLVVFVAVWTWLQREPTPGLVRAAADLLLRPSLPPGFVISPHHAWARAADGGRVQIGLGDLLTGALGALDAVEGPALGAAVERGAPLFILRLGERRLVVPAPLDGTVVAVNHAALAAPDAIIDAPFATELVSVEPSAPRTALQSLRAGDAAVAWLQRELGRLVDVVTTSGQPAVHLADGAHPPAGVLAGVDGAVWDAFQRAFLEPDPAGPGGSANEGEP